MSENAGGGVAGRAGARAEAEPEKGDAGELRTNIRALLIVKIHSLDE